MRELRPADWRNLGEVMAAYDKNPENPGPVVEAFLEAAFARQVPWERDRQGQKTAFGREARLRSRGVSTLLRAMAERATTLEHFAGLFEAMDCAGANGLASATGRGGGVLLDRAARLAGTTPLPHGWQAVAERAIMLGGGRSGGYWARHMLDADRLHGHSGPSGSGLE